MSSLALMRWLEGSPGRYDAGMRILTFGRVAALHGAVAEQAVTKPGQRVLEIGCGTGSVTSLLLERGARVVALDQAPEMLELARARCAGAVEWLEQTASEIDAFAPASFDAVVMCLCLSDMPGSERAFVLREAATRLAPGGRVVVADESLPRGPVARLAQRFWRGPQVALAWMLVGSVSSPLRDVDGELREAGLHVVLEREWLAGALRLVVAEPRG